MRHSATVQVYPGDPLQTIYLPETLEEYAELWRTITAEAVHYDTWRALMRLWSAGDHYFRLLFVMSAGREAWNEWRHEPHFKHPDHIRFARQIQFDGTDDAVHIGARGFGKSTHFVCDDLGNKLEDPNHASCWFSLTRELAQKKLGIIQNELTVNRMLLSLWDDRFWDDPAERAGGAKWSLKDGLTIKRTSTRPEQSFEAHAFEAALPTGIHPDKRYYDDIEADESVTSPVTASTIEDRWVSSQNLASSRRQRAVTGTYYSASGMMKKLGDKYGLKAVIFPGEDLEKPAEPAEAGPFGGTPSNGFTREELWARLKDAGGAEFHEGKWRRVANQKADGDYGRQIACDAQAGEASRLEWKWIQFYDGEAREVGRQMNVVVCVDASNGGDATWIWVWGLSREKELYWLDAERKVLPPQQRKELIHATCSRWRDLAHLCQLRIEQFAASEFASGQEAYHQTLGFSVPIIKCHDNQKSKLERIYDRWQPPCQTGKVFFPHRMLRPDEKGNLVDLVAYFKQFEYGMYPGCRTDDGLDAGGLIWEPEAKVGTMPWPWRRRPGRRERDGHDEGTFASAGVV
jgi:hypothetical protein